MDKVVIPCRVAAAMYGDAAKYEQAFGRYRIRTISVCRAQLRMELTLIHWWNQQGLDNPFKRWLALHPVHG